MACAWKMWAFELSGVIKQRWLTLNSWNRGEGEELIINNNDKDKII